MGNCHNVCGPHGKRADGLNVLDKDVVALPILDQDGFTSAVPSEERPTPNTEGCVEAGAEDQAKHLESDEELENVASEGRYSRRLMKSHSILPVDVRGVQEEKLTSHQGFFVNVGLSEKNAMDTLRQYGFSDEEISSEPDINSLMDQLSLRIIQDETFDGSRITGVLLPQRMLEMKLDGLLLPVYLWERKNIIPIASKEVEMQPEKRGQGVRMVDDCGMDSLAELACKTSVFGVKIRSRITKANEESIQAVLDQMHKLGRLLIGQGLGVVLQVEIELNNEEKAKIEDILVEKFVHVLESFEENEKVILLLTLPSKPKLYMPLMDHRRTLNVLASSSGLDRVASCQMVAKNPGMKACFGRPFMESLRRNHSTKEFSDALDETCRTMLEASHLLSTKENQMIKVGSLEGFFACFDTTESASVRAALKRYGFDTSSMSSESELADAFQIVRARIMSHPRFTNYEVIAAMLSESCVDRLVAGMPTAKYLWEVKKVVPFMNLGRELAAEKNGVQLMKNVTRLQLESLMRKGVDHGIFGIKAFSLIKSANQSGIKSLVKQQFDIAKIVMSKGLVPIISVTVDPSASEKSKCERLLLDALLTGLGGLGADEKIVFELSLPSEPNVYLPLVGHPHTIRVAGNLLQMSNPEVNAALQKNIGMCGSFRLSCIQGLRIDTPDDEFTKLLEEGCKQIYKASTAIPVKEEQMIKVVGQEGFFVALDQSGAAMTSMLQRYGVSAADLGHNEVAEHAQNMITRFLTNPSFNGSRVVCVCLGEATMNSTICDLPAAKYLWNERSIVPFLRIDKGAASMENGVNLLKEIPRTQFNALLVKAQKAGMFGTKVRSSIKQANPTGIKALVAQQFDIGKRILAKGLVPILQPEIDNAAPDRSDSERILFDELLENLHQLASDQRVILLVSLPTNANLYFPLLGHPNVIRVLALSGGVTQSEACQALTQNAGVIACFSRALIEKNKIDQTEEQFTQVLEESCSAVFQASRALPVKKQQMIKLSIQEGFFGGFDHDTSRLPSVLEGYGVPQTEFSKSGSSTDRYPGAHAMQTKFFELCVRVFTNPKFNGSRVIAALLTRDLMGRAIGSQPVAVYLWDHKKVLSFLCIDEGLKDEEDGVRLMKDIPELDSILDKAVVNGVLGTISRSTIKHAKDKGISAIVDQQVGIAKQVIARGLVPILQLEIDPHSPEKAACERVLRQAVTVRLRSLKAHEQVILEFTPPEKPNAYMPLLESPNVLRVACLSGGYSREEACRMVSQNSGIIASFGRAFFSGLHIKQSDKEFTKVLDESCKMIRLASSSAAKQRSSSKESKESKG